MIDVRQLAKNMRRVYVEEQTRLYLGYSVNVPRRNHARKVLVDRCGYTPAMFQRLLAEARRNAGIAP